MSYYLKIERCMRIYITLQINNCVLTDKKKIANLFNSSFVNIGYNLSNKLKDSQQSFEFFLNKASQIDHSIFFYPTTQQEIQDAISKMKPKNTNDIYDISTKLVKLGSRSLSKILEHIFNHFLRNGIFPEKLKTAYIIPFLPR